MTRTRTFLACGAIAIVFLISSCAVPAEVPTVEEPDEPVVQAAEFCRDLVDEAVIEQTWTEGPWSDRAEFDALIVACADNPDANLYELSAELAEAARFSSRLAGTFPVTDDEGYTFNLVVNGGIMSVTSDPSTQPPGFTAAAREFTMTMQIVNTTPQRELTFAEVNGIISPLSYPTFKVDAYFNAGSPVCVAVNPHNDGPCVWILGFGRMESGFTVAAGGTYALKVWGGYPNGGEMSLLLQNIPEGSWAELQPLLSNPDGYRITYDGGDYRRFTTVCGEPIAMSPPIVAQVGVC